MNSKVILRKSGLKATDQRLTILEIFNKAKRPLSAQEIIELLPRPGRNAERSVMDQATIYRTLKSLKKNGIIRPIDLRHNHAHYELAKLAEHHHLICLRCSKVEDVHRCGIEDMQKAVLHSSKHFAEIKQHALEFYGVCTSCAKKTQPALERAALQNSK